MYAFLSAGIPNECKDQGYKGIKCLNSLKLDGMEFEFVYSTKISEENKQFCRDFFENKYVSAHAPYFINLLSEDKNKIEKSIERIIKTAENMHYIKPNSKIVFHPAFYGKYSKEEAYNKIKPQFLKILEELENRGLKVILAPENTGKKSQFGELKELLKLKEDIGIDFTLDVAHYHAREKRLNTKEDFYNLLKSLDFYIDKELHIHFSGIEYGDKGERKHLPISSNSPPWKEFLMVLKELGYSFSIVSESPLNEEDAVKMKTFFESL